MLSWCRALAVPLQRALLNTTYVQPPSYWVPKATPRLPILNLSPVHDLCLGQTYRGFACGGTCGAGGAKTPPKPTPAKKVEAKKSTKSTSKGKKPTKGKKKSTGKKKCPKKEIVVEEKVEKKKCEKKKWTPKCR